MSGDNETGPWWKTLPGILTAFGSAIAAVAALVVALTQAGFLGPGKTPTSAPLSNTSAVKPAPQAESMPVGGPAPLQPKSVPTPAIGTSAAIEPSTKIEPAPPGPAVSADALLGVLAKANVGYSVSAAVMKQWIDTPQTRYRNLAEAVLHALGGKPLAGKGADLDMVNYRYVRLSGLPEDADIPAGQAIDSRRVQEALIAAYAEKNGGRAKTLAEIVK